LDAKWTGPLESHFVTVAYYLGRWPLFFFRCTFWIPEDSYMYFSKFFWPGIYTLLKFLFGTVKYVNVVSMRPFDLQDYFNPFPFHNEFGQIYPWILLKDYRCYRVTM
jgi:hypothetical protein